MAKWRTPEGSRCECGHVFGRHTGVGVACGTPDCSCSFFHQAGSRISLDRMAARIADPAVTDKAEAAIERAIRRSLLYAGFIAADYREWNADRSADEWRLIMRRAWKAWNEAGRPYEIGGPDSPRVFRQAAVSVPELEE